ncbi:MAG TPA: DUF4861 domain-containing protein [Chryseolinea sp.]|nr:DUF4861 domain-containing protein [Chryseolinea sp.]
MKNLVAIILAFALYGSAVAQTLERDFPLSFKVKVSNLSDAARENCMVIISPDDIQKQTKKFNSKAFVVLDKAVEIPSQYNTEDIDKGIVFVIPKLEKRESKEFTIRYHATDVKPRNYTKRTQAELSHKVDGKFVNREYIGGTFKNVDYLRVPPEHKDHSWFIRYEGPGWESDKVGYRFYLDQRNATDVFGKKGPEMVLQNVGLDGFDSYHEIQPWGMDVMKVGKSLGVGSIGAFENGKTIRVEKTDSVTCRITENGVVYSSILTNYYGWKLGGKKYDVQSTISIHAGTRLSHQILSVTNNPDTLCTGIVKDKLAKVFKSKGDAQHWGYIATYGNQSLNNDALGLVVFFNPANALGFKEDEFSEIIALKPNMGKLEYYFEGAWELEANGISNETEFLSYIQSMASQLSQPVSAR